jgi:hypothetical protein
MYEMIVDFRNLSNPPKSEIEKHAQKVQEVIQQLGHKYRLARPMPRITQGSKQ